jgi:murein L,D-transpeptidase YafK
MMILIRIFFIALMTVAASISAHAKGRAERAEQNVIADLSADAARLELAVGAPVFIRLFKEEATLELWLASKQVSPDRRHDGQVSPDRRHDRQVFKLFRSYPICAYSGGLGPKLREGDGQAPEGVYWVGAKQLNPFSNFHLSFNLGYPNAFDRAHARTGSALMVHGNCVSIGCFAMTDAKIEEIYTLMSKAFAAGQAQVQVHALPFRMTTKRLAEASADPNIAFWRDLATIDAAFEKTLTPPTVRVRNKRYRLE